MIPRCTRAPLFPTSSLWMGPPARLDILHRRSGAGDPSRRVPSRRAGDQRGPPGARARRGETACGAAQVSLRGALPGALIPRLPPAGLCDGAPWAQGGRYPDLRQGTRGGWSPPGMIRPPRPKTLAERREARASQRSFRSARLTSSRSNRSGSKSPPHHSVYRSCLGCEGSLTASRKSS